MDTSVTLTGYKELLRELTFFQKVGLARALQDSLNKDVAPALRAAESEHMRGIFRDPVPFTLAAPMTSEWATFDKLEINFKHRDEVAKGNPPAKYLYPQTTGSPVYVTRLTRRLQYQGHIDQNQYVMHWGFGIGPGAKSRNGRVTGGFVQQVLASLDRASRGESAVGPVRSGAKYARLVNRGAEEYFVLSGKSAGTAKATRRRTPPQTSRASGFDGPGVYTSKSGQLQRVFRILNRIPTVQQRYQWTPERIGRVAEPVFTAAVSRRLDAILGR